MVHREVVKDSFALLQEDARLNPVLSGTVVLLKPNIGWKRTTPVLDVL